MSIPDKPQFNERIEREALVANAARLNGLMISGASVYEIECSRLIRSFPRPIVVDFNNVLVNSRRPWEPNPYAGDMLDQLTNIGTVFVVTSAAGDFELRKQALESFGLWHKGMVMITNDNLIIPSNEDAERVMDEYRQVINRPLSDEEEAHIRHGEKRLAPVFGKPFDVPIIDDSPRVTENNPRMLGLAVKAFAPYSHLEQETKSQLSLAQAVDKVREHYLVPFRDTLITTGFEKEGAITGIKMLKYHPEIIVRIVNRSEGNLLEQDIREAPRILNELEERYGINVPKRRMVIGPPLRAGNRQTYYFVTERIHGDNLRHAVYPPEEIGSAVPHIDSLYSSIAQYLWDTFEHGGVYIDDITFSNEQYVYGKRKGEDTNKVWLVDIGPQTMPIAPKSPEILNRAENLFEMITESELRLGVKLSASRQKLIEFLRSIPSSSHLYHSALVLRRKFGETGIGTDEQDKLEALNKLNSYKETLTQIDFDANEWRTLLNEFFDQYRKTLESALAAMDNEEQMYLYREMKTIDNYNYYERFLLGDFVRRKIKEKFIQAVGRDILAALRDRYGFIVDTILEEMLEPRQKEIVTKQDPKDFEIAKLEANKSMLANIGWETDILSHLKVASELLGGDMTAAEYCLPLAAAQLGWDYRFPYNSGEVRAMFEQSDLEGKDEDGYSDFVFDLLDRHMDAIIGTKLEAVKSRYSEDTASILAEQFRIRESERVLKVAN